MRRSTRAHQMTIGWAMLQLSRPFQAIVAGLALFVLVWFVALHRPGSASTGSGSSAGSSGAPSASTAATHSATASHAAPASHRAGAARRAGASHAASGSHRASGQAGATVGHQHSTAVQTHKAVHTHKTVQTHKAVHTHKAPPRTSAPGHPGAAANATHTPALQATVAAKLKQGRMALLLFWNPRSSDDQAVHRQLLSVAHKLGRRVAVHTAAANQTSAFGSITQDVQVYQTPTLLIVNPKGQVTTVTGYTDAYSLEQTIREARG